MKVTIKQKHKSITPPCEFELPDFSVLTGKNGSGKTHLLEAIADKDKASVYIDGKLAENVRYIGFNGLNPNIQEACDPNTITQHIKNVWNQYNSAKNSILAQKANYNLSRLLLHIENIGSTPSPVTKKYIEKTIQDSGKEFDQLNEDDFANSFDTSFLGQNSFFTAQFALIFKNYHVKQEENNINEYYHSKEMPFKPFLTESEFKKRFGIPPWEFVNKILLETNIPYEVNSPVGSRLDSNFTFRLKDRKDGFEISSADLSTGEKVLMSLALAIYNTSGNLGKPDVLLLDEPDAGLHPSMSKMMVNILNTNIVIENKIPVIISTHSPTTVIASEGVSIFQLVRGTNIPTKIPTQEAVEMLSSDIPFLRISTDKRRQVFVESKYDVNYYELLTNIYSRIETLPSEPIYLPARTSMGSNCTDVINIVKSLSTNGNDQVYGIIDWDSTNATTGNILVLGENERYAIENYLLDPLLMGLLFIRERKLNFSDFGLAAYATYSEVNKLIQEDAQLILNKVLQDLGLLSTNLLDNKLQNGWIVKISAEFNHHQGHDLETLYKSKYPFLNAYHKEDTLKKDIIEKVINDYPQFTPIQIFETIKKIK